MRTIGADDWDGEKDEVWDDCCVEVHVRLDVVASTTDGAEDIEKAEALLKLLDADRIRRLDEVED